MSAGMAGYSAGSSAGSSAGRAESDAAAAGGVCNETEQRHTASHTGGLSHDGSAVILGRVIPPSG